MSYLLYFTKCAGRTVVLRAAYMLQGKKIHHCPLFCQVLCFNISVNFCGCGVGKSPHTEARRHRGGGLRLLAGADCCPPRPTHEDDAAPLFSLGGLQGACPLHLSFPGGAVLGKRTSHGGTETQRGKKKAGWRPCFGTRTLSLSKCPLTFALQSLR
jgi:hypothetical protein